MSPGSAVEDAFRTEWGRVLGAVARSTGDLDLAEESAQEAFASALRTWERDGVPERPGAWLTTTARRHAIDVLRRRRVEADRTSAAARLGERVDAGRAVGPAADPVPEEVTLALDDDAWELDDPDGDVLRLLFTCCHPALPAEARVALTLRSLTGMTTAQVARAFLVPEATMAQRLVRAKRRIRATGISFRVPPPELRAERVTGVLTVIYLLFTEGYDSWAEPAQETVGSAERRALADDAVRLARLAARLLDDEPEARGLLALLLLQHARRDERTAPDGSARTLAEQDPARWRHDEITDGLHELDVALAAGRPGPYQVQAAIAALHDGAGSDTSDDDRAARWVEILGLYDVLLTMTGSPVVALNRAVAVAEVQGPAAGLAAVDAVADASALAGYHLLPAVRAELHTRAGRPVEAATDLRAALELVDREGDRRLLRRRLAELSGVTTGHVVAPS
ncbi:RNA polymerase sigma factor [Cellulosimicrobium arenosum]|uniref:Sigma-70 family RNA polymerase sigma factor n=1 Tax=Cellulosimicrobium arenosum TaxID=2708133 RepID=A0A927G7W4_9MICO|nr:sigma-70 family RNA polymerase sigma factor [Cellulosimicrobium arenosum]MBD8078348.1 sigma-70 family RNA polymerase sigma factor [Cellulosimicrobium arenosum]